MNLVSLNSEFITDVGLFSWVSRTAQRQFYKRVLGRNHAMKLPSGEIFSLPIRSHFASEAFITNANVDWGSESLLYKLLKNKGSFLDVGANIGYYSLYMSPKVKNVYCFEPDYRMLEMLEDNLHGREDAYIVNKAVGREPGKASFTLEDSGEISHLSRDTDDESKSVSVDVVSIDSFVDEHHLTVEAIKTDVEGFDIDVIRGAVETMRSQRPIVLTECEPNSELFEILSQLHYSVFSFVRKLDRVKPQLMKITDELEKTCRTKMLLLLPKESPVANETVLSQVYLS